MAHSRATLTALLVAAFLLITGIAAYTGKFSVASALVPGGAGARHHANTQASSSHADEDGSRAPVMDLELAIPPKKDYSNRDVVVRGEVLGPRGVRAAQARVEVIIQSHSGKEASAYVNCDDFGQWRLSVSPDFPFRISCKVSGPDLLAPSSNREVLGPLDLVDPLLVRFAHPNANVRGKVCDSDGKGVRGARIWTYCGASTTSGPGGEFQLDVSLPPASRSYVYLCATGHGRVRRLLEYDSTSRGIYDLGVILLEAEAVLAGVILDHDGLPIDEARIQLFPPQEEPVWSDQWGNFRLAGLARGTTTLTATKKGHNTVSRRVAIAATNADITMIMGRSVIVSGVVRTAKNDPLKNVVVRDGRSRQVLGLSNEFGQFSFSATAPLPMQVSLSKEGHVTKQVTVISQTAENMLVTLDEACLSHGRLVDTGGAGLGGILVRLIEANGRPNHFCQAISAPDGTFELWSDPSAIGISISSRKHVASSHEVSSWCGDLGNFELDECVPLQGKVVDSLSGLAIRHFTVVLAPCDEGSSLQGLPGDLFSEGRSFDQASGIFAIADHGLHSDSGCRVTVKAVGYLAKEVRLESLGKDQLLHIPVVALEHE